MKTVASFFLLIFLVNNSLGQISAVSSKQLSQQEIDSIFTDSLISNLSIEFNIYRIYEYHDKKGKHFLVMTENEYDAQEREQSFDSIKAYCYSLNNGVFTLDWRLTDFILPNGNEVSQEYSISFWTKYFALDDYDKDGVIDPILVYGTLGMNQTHDGRIKILVYHNGKKSAIRHQNGTLDFERNTLVDKEFYKLPTDIQDRVKVIMNKITAESHGIFPSGWEEAMDNRKLKFDEN